jgi:predicted site-specific integrase-resolvase
MIQSGLMTKIVIDTNEVCDMAEAQSRLGISRATLFRWIRDGKVRPLKLNGRTYIPVSEIAFLKS